MLGKRVLAGVKVSSIRRLGEIKNAVKWICLLRNPHAGICVRNLRSILNTAGLPFRSGQINSIKAYL